jgi:CSLREA domain-containing protein
MFRRRMRKLTSPVSDTVQRLRRRFRPTIEILEERRLMSTYTVNSLTDTNTGTGNSGDLRYCIDHANFNPGANTITFDPTVFATHQTITLGSNALVLVNSTGLQTITGPAAGVTIDAGSKSVAFKVDGNASMTGLTVANGGTSGGTTQGGDIFNEGSLTLTDCTITGGVAADGGGLYNSPAGVVTLNNCTISGSVAAFNGGGLFNQGKAYVTGGSFSSDSAIAGGGGVWNGTSATATVSGCSISTNAAAVNGGGLYNQGKAYVTGGSFSGDSAANGGGVWNGTGATATVSGCSISTNSAAVSGGGLYDLGKAYVTGSSFSGDSAANGGGLGNGKSATVTVSGCNISNNTSSTDGGGIWSYANLTLTDSTVSGNKSNHEGGGILSRGSLTITNCTVTNNTAGTFGVTNGYGGGIAGLVNMQDCTVSGNTASTGGGLSGGGTILNSTFANNQGYQRGGGVANYGGVSMTNCTVYANKAFYVEKNLDGTTTDHPGKGGGIYSSWPATLTNCTVAGNKASRLRNGGSGGDIFNNSSNFILNNCLIAYSAAYGGDITGNAVVSGHNNLIDDKVHAGGLSSANNNYYVPSNQLHLYTPSTNYGGPTATVMPEFDPALNAVSPVIGRGDPSLIPAGVTTDQRGVSRISVSPNGTVTVDIGAVERSVVGTYNGTPVNRPNVIVVTTLTDEDDGAALPELGSGTSLREAINLANVDKGGNDVIKFAPGLSGALDLTLGALPALTADVNIFGPGANVLTIDAQGASQILPIAPGSTAVVDGLTLSGGNGVNGGAVSNAGTLTIDACTIANNSATHAGGGVWSSGTLTLSASTLSGNTAGEAGGGVIAAGGALTMTNCTVYDNTAGSATQASDGGGICVAPVPVTLTNCTIVGNSSINGAGGGIEGGNQPLTLNNSIVAKNGSGGDIVAAVSGSNNLVDDPATAGIVLGMLVNGVNGNIVGLDPMLGPLAYNGGPTETMVPQAGSPAIEGGDSALVPADVVTDQRGTLRIKSSAVCIGSVEVGPLVILVTSLADTEQRGTLRHSIEAIGNIDPTDPVTITFAAGLTGTITLTDGPLPAITMDVTIVGPGANFLTIDGNSQGNIFTVQAGGTLDLVGLTLAHGQATEAGGITNFGTLALRDCTIDSNNGTAGGIANFGSLAMLGCTVSNNTSYRGGALDNEGTATLSNCTLYKNQAGYGGGIYNSVSGTLTLDDCTVAANSAVGLGGGIYNASSTAVTLNNCIVANNAVGLDVAGPFADNSTFIGDLNPTLVDPMLGTLGYYGGPTETLPLLPGSPAIDAGNSALFPTGGLLMDQRGAPRLNASGSLDQGAFQSGPAEILVTTLADVDNGSIDLLNSTGVSLREAINFANADPSGGDTIIFSPLLSGTLTMTDGALPTITAAMTIQGPGANVLTIDAGGQSRILVLSASADVTMSGLTLANGSAGSTSGGAIANFGGTLNLTNCTLSGNKAVYGAGLYSTGTSTLTGCTLSGNAAAFFGGGLYSSGTLSMTNCTVSGNTAQSSGGLDLTGVSNTLVHCTVYDNTGTVSASNFVAGIYILGAGTTLDDTIVVGNSGPSGASDLGGSGTASGSYNLIGTGSVTGSNNQLGVSDPKLGLLAWNGGPTQTVALLPGSPAIGASNASGVTTDQRGLPLDSPSADIGAFQFQGLPPSVTISGPPTGTVGIAGSFTFTATDPTPADQNGVFTYIVDWNGDGSDVETYTREPATFTVAHAYQATGSYTPSVTVVDQDFRNSAPAFLSTPVQVSAASAQAVTTEILTTTTVQLVATTPAGFSDALNAVDQVPPNTWMSSNAADIKLQGGASSVGVVVNPTSPNATINVSSANVDELQRVEDLSASTIYALNNATNDQLELVSVVIAAMAVGAGVGGGAVGEGVEIAEEDIGDELVAQGFGRNEIFGPASDEIISTFQGNNILVGAGIGGLAGGGGAALTATGFVELGGSPALTVEQGIVTWSNALMGTNTDAPTVLVRGGALNLTDNVITGNVSGSQPLIEDDGGTLILGSADGTLGNVLATYNNAAFLHVALDGEVIVEPGNSFAQISGVTAQAAGATSVQLVSSLPVATPGQTVTFTATVTANGAAATDGSVEFFDDTTGNFLGMVPVNNGSASVQATFNDLTGGDTIYATYLPTTGALAPSSGNATQQVSNATQTTLTGPSSSPTYGQAVTFTATITSPATSAGAPTGSVEFFDGMADLGAGTALSASGNSATSTFTMPTSTIATLTAGPHAIQAVFMPSGLFQGSSDTLNLNVIQAMPTLSINPVNITYGTALDNGQLTSDTASWTVVGIPVTVMGTFTYNSPAGTVLNAGAQQSVTVTFTPNDTTDYTTETGSVTVNVAQAHLSVMADNKSRTFGTANPPLTFTLEGFVGNDNASVVSGAPTLSTTAGISSPVGSYPITVVNTGTLSALNYDFPSSLFVSGTLNVTLPSQSVYVLNATASGALSASGNAVLKLPGGLFVDSNSASAIVASGKAQVDVGGTVLVVGGVSVSGSASCTATGTPGSTNDPLGGLPLPSVSGLTNYGAVSVSGNNTQTLSPGIYTSIQISGKASVTLNPGTYIIEGGGLSVSGSGNLSGSGVTIFNAGSQYNGTTDGGTFGSISIGGQGTITLSAPTSGVYAGVTIFQSRANSKALALGGSGTATITGTVYAAAANAGLSGNAQVTGSLVVSTLTVSGNAGAFQLADGSSSSYTVSTSNWISNGILSVWAEDDTGTGLNSDKVNRLSDAMTYLNSALGSFGVSLSWAADATSADVTVHFATSTPEGDASAGVIGFTTPDNNVYFVTTWNYYNGSDPTQIASNQLDFETLAIHELAHTVGLGESADANSVMYEYLAPGTVRRTFTDSNLSLINTNSDRFNFAAGARPGAWAFEEMIASGGTFGTNSGLNPSPSGGKLSRMLDNWTPQSDAVNTLVAARSSDQGMAATGRHGARVLGERGHGLDRFWEAYASVETWGFEF